MPEPYVRIRRADGSIKMTEQSFLARRLGKFTLASTDGSGSMNVPDLGQGKPWVIVIPTDGGYGASSKFPHAVSVSGTTISWAPGGYSASVRCGSIVLYGTY